MEGEVDISSMSKNNVCNNLPIFDMRVLAIRNADKSSKGIIRYSAFFKKKNTMWCQPRDTLNILRHLNN